MSVNLALVGATGLVGQALMEQLVERQLPSGELFVLASENSRGKTLRAGKRSFKVGHAEDFDFSQVQIAVFAAGAAVSQELVPRAVDAGALVLDLSPAYRYEEDVPLVVAGVNDEQLSAARERNLVATADAATVQLLLALKPLLALGDLTRVSVTQLQGGSAAGRNGVELLARQSARLLNGLDADEGATAQHAFNLLPVAGRVQDNGYTSEELKLMLETRRVLGQPGLAVDATCVQVPVFHGVAQTVVVQGTMPLGMAQAETCWAQAPGLQLEGDAGDDERGDDASPVRQINSGLGVRLARVREDLDGQGALSFWTVADNVKTGAALNAALLVEKLLKDHL